ncbi:MAG: ABC transporter permease, partial [Bacteriovoracales bacterium]
MLKLSIKYLLSKKTQTFFTLFGIVLGSFAFVAINGFFQGFQGFLMQNLVNNNAHIKITPKDSTPTIEALQSRIYKNGPLVHFINNPKQQKVRDFIQSPELWYRRLKFDKDVVAFSPQITSNAMVTHTSTPYAVKLVGVDPAEQAKITDIENKMVEGTMKGLEKRNSFVIGSGLANRVGSYLSDLIYLNIGDGPSTPFKVRGIFSTGIRDFDDNTIYANYEDAWEIIKAKGRINSIGIRLKDFKDASLKVSQWKGVSDERIESWDQINKNFLNVFKIQNVTRYLMVLITVIVASFGIFNVLN